VTGDKQTLPIKTMSPGFRARLVFCLMSLRNPHMLLLDEPTNPLDMDMIDSLALAIKNFAGGLVLVSHDFRLLEQVRQHPWSHHQLTRTPTSPSPSDRRHLRARTGGRRDLGVRREEDHAMEGRHQVVQGEAAPRHGQGLR
jgi:ATP-binding cassette subfamily F protein 2